MAMAKMLPIQGESAVVIGAGRSGMAAVRLLVHCGAKVRLLEKDASKISQEFLDFMQKNQVELVCGEHNAQHFALAKYVIPSPGLPISSIESMLSKDQAPEIMGEMELAYRCLEEEKILAVTGTSGKTTTVSLAAAMLKEQGYSVFLGGNIGTPLSEYVLSVANGHQRADVLVLELSSFQLQTCTTFRPHVAVLLNISENHLDYHKDMQEYVDAKMRIFACQGDNDKAIIHASLQYMLVDYLPKSRIYTYENSQGIFSKSQLLGAHNAINMEVAFLASKHLGVGLEAAQRAVAAFAPLEHRLEKVRELDCVLYVNDSKCTTVDALRVALQAFTERPVILLCGGKFKGGDLASLRPLLKKYVKSVQLFGASRNYFEDAWKDIVPMHWSATMNEALRIAKQNAQSGDAIVLAPATSSFDLYDNYMARGQHFKELVAAL